MRKVLLLGASGSIGTQTLDILEKEPSSFELVAISLGHQISKIPAILARFPSIRKVVVLEKEDKERLEKDIPDISFDYGEEGILSLIQESDCDMVVNAIVGFAGLLPSLEALKQNKILCLANKESLVVGGYFIRKLLQEGHGTLYPIDSEHVALAKCLKAVSPSDVDELILTGSGGSFRNKRREELLSVTPEEALHHPTWKMGARITIDCATMMNKGFEVIEAKELFDYPLSKISIVLHDESQVHSLIKLKNGSYLADIGPADMHGPISYALHEEKEETKLTSFYSFEELEGLHFHPFNEERYPAVSLALEASSMPLGATCVLNAADEEAVSLFLNHKIPFLDIEKIVSKAIHSVSKEIKCPLDLVELDKETREYISHMEERK